MDPALLRRLCCPDCGGNVELSDDSLGCLGCDLGVPLRDGIPRFSEDGYAASFGHQWHRFRQTQLDSINGTHLSADRFWAETGWTAAWLKGKWILDAGCGAGRFVEVAHAAGAHVVAMDMSASVDAIEPRQGVHRVQASLYRMPFRPGSFDGIYCLGVLQHTPDPGTALRRLPALLAAGGRLAITAYERRRFTLLNGKYLVRRYTAGRDPLQLMRWLARSMPFLFPLTDVLFRLPLVGRLCRFGIPVANYVDSALSRRQRYEWCLLDTFDMLAPRYDQPLRPAEVHTILCAAGLSDVRRRPGPGLTIVAQRRPP